MLLIWVWSNSASGSRELQGHPPRPGAGSESCHIPCRVLLTPVRSPTRARQQYPPPGAVAQNTGWGLPDLPERHGGVTTWFPLTSVASAPYTPPPPPPDSGIPSSRLFLGTAYYTCFHLLRKVRQNVEFGRSH